jgi:beta-lactam-binding protein with PASTA domain
MRTCQSCGLQNPPDRDFCECGEYLRWEPTAVVSAVTPEMLAKAAEEAPPAEPQTPPQTPPPAPAEPAAETPAAAAPPEPEAPVPAPQPAPEPTGYIEATPPPPPARVEEAAPPEPEEPANGRGAAPAPPAAAAQPPDAPTGPKGTQIMGAVPTPPPAPPPPAVPDEPDMATITLRMPDADSDKEHTLLATVEPGQRERVLALVRNQSGIVDNYKLTVEGLPQEWWSIYPDTVYLVPFGSGGTYEQEVEIHLHPPRTPKAEAKLWELKVVAHSKAHEKTATEEPLALAIKPYIDTTTKVRPERKKGRRKADYDVAVENKANAPVLIALEGEDPDAELQYGFNRPPVEIPPGQTVTAKMRVRPPKQLWIGRPQERRFNVITLTGEKAEERLAAEPTAADALRGQTPSIRKTIFGRVKSGDLPGAYGPRVYKPQVYAPGMNIGPSGISLRKPTFQAPQLQGPQMKGMNVDASQLQQKLGGAGGGGTPPPQMPLLPSQAIFRQKPWLPWWLIPVGIAIAAIAVMLYLLLPKNTVVPKVIGAKAAFDAEKTLTKNNLKLNPEKKTEVNTKVKPGTVVKQDPPPGKKVEKDSAVSIVVATGSGKIVVPDVKGKNLSDAEKGLRAKKLTLGQANPQPPNPKFLVKTQIPDAGETVKEGEPVNVFLAPPPKDPKQAAKDKKNAASSKNPSAPPAPGEGKADIVIPAFKGSNLADYAGKLGELKLAPVKIVAYDGSKPGTVFKTDPEPGTKAAAGAQVKVFVSAGFPKIAFDNDKDILLSNGFNGKPQKPIADSQRIERDPTYSDDGTHIAYQANNQVFLVDLTKPNSSPQPLTVQGELFKDITFAPTPEVNLLSMLREGKDKSRQLCLEVVTKTTLGPKCLPKPPGGITLDRKINWSPDGKQMLVFGFTPTKIGMVRYRSKKPFSADPKDWKTSGTGFATDTTNPGQGVLDAAFSPNGKTLAVVSNLNPQKQFRLSTTKPSDLLTLSKATPKGVQACQVIWRPDGLEVAVIQSDDCSGHSNGTLRRVGIENAKIDQVQLGLNADNPSFEPLPLGG